MQQVEQPVIHQQGRRKVNASVNFEYISPPLLRQTMEVGHFHLRQSPCAHVPFHAAPSSGVPSATEELPIKMPSGPCWPPDDHMPRMHHVGAPSSPLPLHFTISS
ncbi:hypothetical protein Q5P01_018538 [Channa striata]|uniref:Uncharacterized protein n=1 Tax=Channa striata TaxID=64152 RepID=A0AA88M7X6_CHASR|nr:hypothetical protein Q5P01_018538 [Channa striata]